MCDKQHYDDLIKDMEDLKQEVTELRQDAQKSIDKFIESIDGLHVAITESNDSTKDLKEAWDNASGFVKSVKWLSGFIVACGVIYATVQVILGIK